MCEINFKSFESEEFKKCKHRMIMKLLNKNILSWCDSSKATHNCVNKLLIKFSAEGDHVMVAKLFDIWARKHHEYGVKKSGASPYKPEDYNNIKNDFLKIYENNTII